MKTIGSLILLTALAMLVLCGTIAAEELTGEASGNSTEATAAGNVISPILAVMDFCVLVVGVMIAVNAFR